MLYTGERDILQFFLQFFLLTIHVFFMDINLAIVLISVVVNLFLVGIILIQRKSIRYHTAITTFIISVVGLVFWSITNYLADTSTSPGGALFWTRATFPPSLLMVWMIWWFSTLFPSERLDHHPAMRSIYATLAVLAGFLSFTKHVIYSVSLDLGVGIDDIALGKAYIFVMLLYLLFIAHTLTNFVRSFLHSYSIEKLQLSYVLIGWGIFLFGAASTNLILPALTDNASWSKFGPIFSVAMVGCTTYAIIRHHLMDIRIIIQRGLIYLCIATIIICLYLLLVFSIGRFFSQYIQIQEIFSVVLTTLFGIFTVPILDRFLRKITHPWFFKYDYDYLDATKALQDVTQSHIRMEGLIHSTIEEMSSILSLRKMAITSLSQDRFFQKKSTIAIDRIFSQEQISELRKNTERIFFPDNKDHCGAARWMEENNYVLYVPIIFNDRPTGGIFLGSRRSGDPFFKKDHYLVEQLSHHLSAAMEKALLFEKEREQSKLLEEQVKKRTQEINFLQKSQEKMMVDISHALKTPLSVLRIQLDKLALLHDQRTDVHSLQYSIDDVSKSISSLLMLTRMENAQQLQKTSHTIIDLSAIAELLCDHFIPVAADADITLDHDISPLCLISGNHDEIENLIVNLLENAIKYIPSDHQEKKISLSLSHVDGSAVLVVTDSGNGVPQDDLAHIFDRFYRSISDNTHSVSGSGLGLSICKEIVKNHHGTIVAKNLIEGGFSFTVTFPASSRNTLS